MAEIDLRNPPNEMPDIVGYKPDNPVLASFRPFVPGWNDAGLRVFWFDKLAYFLQPLSRTDSNRRKTIPR